MATKAKAKEKALRRRKSEGLESKVLAKKAIVKEIPLRTDQTKTAQARAV